MSDYQTALQQLEQLITHMQTHPAPDSAHAQKHEQELIRMSLTKRLLLPNDTQTIQKIEQYYQHYFAKHHE